MSEFDNPDLRHIPDATVGRLPLYLRCLTELADTKETISSDELAQRADVNAAKVRKDFSFIGFSGVRGTGYNVEQLRTLIRRKLGMTKDWSLALIGMGNLGMALANYRGLVLRGFSIVALFDNDPEKVGDKVNDIAISSLDSMAEIVAERAITMGIITTPPSAAQSVLDALVKAGVNSILSFAPTMLSAPPGVFVRKVDLSLDLQILGYYSMRSEIEDMTAKVNPPQGQ